MVLDNIFVTRLEKELTAEYKKDDGWFFCDRLEDSGAVEEEFTFPLEVFEDRYSSTLFFEILAHFSFARSIQASFYLKDNDKFFEEFNRARTYGYYMLVLGSRSCKCMRGEGNVAMHRSAIHLAMNIIAQDWDKVNQIGSCLIDSVNANNCIIKRGDRDALGAWFLLELYSKIEKKEIIKKRALYPKEFFPYDEVLEKWDTEDMQELDKMVFLLSDVYLESAMFPLDERNEESKRAKLELPHIQIVPYEILSWLAFRNKMGLSNPKEFSHRLMNTTIAKIFLGIVEPLSEPKELPYSKELLQKLKKQCPEIEIDDNLLPIDEIKIEEQESIDKDFLLVAPSTGKYQAILPEDHAQAEALKNDPRAYFTYQEGQRFLCSDLNDYEIEKITWILMGYN